MECKLVQKNLEVKLMAAHLLPDSYTNCRVFYAIFLFSFFEIKNDWEFFEEGHEQRLKFSREIRSEILQTQKYFLYFSF